MLATVALALAAGGLALEGSIPSFAGVAFGIVLTVGFEGLAAFRVETVERLWADPRVRLASVTLSVAVIAVAVVIEASLVLAVVVGLLGSYLLLLGFVAWGIVPPVTEWVE